MKRYFHYAVLALVVTAFCSVMSLAQAASAGETSVSLGAEYTSGDYGTSSNTKMWYFPVTLRYETDRYMMALIVPYLIIEGSGDVVASGGRHGTPRPNPNPTNQGTQTDSGLGDIELVASHVIAQSEAGWRVSLGGYIKFGTAMSKIIWARARMIFRFIWRRIGRTAITRSSVLRDTRCWEICRESITTMSSSDRWEYPTGSMPLAPLAWNCIWSKRRYPCGWTVGIDAIFEQQAGGETRLTGYVIAGFADGSPTGGLELPSR